MITVTTAAQTGGLDLILVPGLAFDLTGGRLGRGKGCVSNKTFNCVLILPRFYDKLLNDYKAIQSDEFKFPQKGTSPRKKWNTANLYLVSIAFNEQIVENIPTEPHDHPIDLVISCSNKNEQT